MAVEKFLQFWTAHNTRIIEVLIALILLLSIYIAFRALFGKAEAQSEGGQFDSTQLEKTLQKILENQNKDGSAAASPVAAAMDAMSASLDISDSNEEAKQVAEKMSAEVERYKAQLAEKIKEVEALKTQLAEAQSAGAGATAAAPVAASSGGMGADEKESYEGKIKDLEARLSEYEIIAEDIADLSMYKEENEKLKAEIEALKAEIEKLKASGGAVAGPTIALDPALDIPSDLAALMEQPAAVEEEAAPAVAAEKAVVEQPAPAAPAPVEASAPAAAGGDDAGLISDDLMAEFEAAVAEQKGSPKAAADVKLPEESDQLMDEFEKFVKKG